MNKTKPNEAAHNARLIARTAQKGALATNRRAAPAQAQSPKQNHPYVSKVGVALDLDGAPLFLFSTLAAHTQDLLADPRAAILLEAHTAALNPLEGARCSLIGQVHPLDGDAGVQAKARYLAHHPGAAQYANFRDFALWRMDVEKVHYVGGFGRAKWARGKHYLTSVPDLAKAAERIATDLATTCRDDVARVFKNVTGKSARGWKVLAVDSDGFSLFGPKGMWQRIDFPTPAKDVRGWRSRFRILVKRARSQ